VYSNQSAPKHFKSLTRVAEGTRSYHYSHLRLTASYPSRERGLAEYHGCKLFAEQLAFSFTFFDSRPSFASAFEGLNLRSKILASYIG
jgi:hypothetical protein